MTLTKYQEGSARELLSISFPLMLSGLSVMAMLFVDRLLLAQYSQEAFNAAISASTLGWALVLGWLVQSNISEVFVAQFNGAGSREKIGSPVWQMIWLGFGSIIFFIPLAIWGGNLIWGSTEYYSLQREYFSWMMLFGPSYPIYGALSGFYVGRGKVVLITVLSIITNLINAILDVILIFGIEGYVPSLGVAGAAIATSGSVIFQALVLGIGFLHSRNRHQFNTTLCRINPRLFYDCLKVGFPGALFSTFEMLGWALFYMMMTSASEKHIIIAGISQSLVILFYFFGEGINKGVTTIAGNLIGAKNLSKVRSSIFAGIKLHLIFFFLLIIIFYFFGNDLGSLFLNLPEQALSENFLFSLQVCIYLVIFYILFEGLRLMYAGALTAAGDTLFLLIAGASSIWLFLVVPVYITVFVFEGSIELAQTITVFYALGAYLIYWWRFSSEKWKALKITTS